MSMNVTYLKNFVKKNGAYLALFLLFFVSANLTDGSFLGERNLSHLFRQASINGVLAVGMTLVILVGGIDLSIGSLVALCGVVGGLAQTQFGMMDAGVMGATLSALFSVGAGFLLGATNGALIAYPRIPPFVITLGAMVIARGLALLLTDGAALSPFSEEFTWFSDAYFDGPLGYAFCFLILLYFVWRMKDSFSQSLFPALTTLIFIGAFLSYRGLPILGLIFFSILIFFDFILQRTVYGRALYAVGANEQAAYWAGINTKIIKVSAFTLLGALSGVASVMLSARLNSASPTAGQLFELDAIASVVIGGTSLKGGVGSLLGTLAGVLIMATVNNGMDLLQVPSFYQMILKGLIIIIAVGLDSSQREGI